METVVIKRQKNQLLDNHNTSYLYLYVLKWCEHGLTLFVMGAVGRGIYKGVGQAPRPTLFRGFFTPEFYILIELLQSCAHPFKPKTRFFRVQQKATEHCDV